MDPSVAPPLAPQPECRLQWLPEELLLAVIARLTSSKDLTAFRATCRWARDAVSASAESLELRLGGLW